MTVLPSFHRGGRNLTGTIRSAPSFSPRRFSAVLLNNHVQFTDNRKNAHQRLTAKARRTRRRILLILGLCAIRVSAVQMFALWSRVFQSSILILRALKLIDLISLRSRLLFLKKSNSRRVVRNSAASANTHVVAVTCSSAPEFDSK